MVYGGASLLFPRIGDGLSEMLTSFPPLCCACSVYPTVFAHLCGPLATPPQLVGATPLGRCSVNAREGRSVVRVRGCERSWARYLGTGVPGGDDTDCIDGYFYDPGVLPGAFCLFTSLSLCSTPTMRHTVHHLTLFRPHRTLRKILPVLNVGPASATTRETRSSSPRASRLSMRALASIRRRS